MEAETLDQRRSGPGGIEVALVLGTAVAAAILGYLLFTHEEPTGEWHLVNLGQEKAVRILSSAPSGVAYFQTNEGNVYACEFSRCKQAPLTQVPGASQPCGEPRYTAPQPPGDVSESTAQTLCGLCRGQTNFVILRDGSVWNWSWVTCCELGCAVSDFFSCVISWFAAGLGLGVGIAIVAVRRRLQRKAAFTSSSQ